MKFLVILFALVAVATCRPGGAHHQPEPQTIRVQVQQQQQQHHAPPAPPPSPVSLIFVDS